MTRIAACCILAIVGCTGCAASDGIPETLIADYYTGSKRPESQSLDGCVWILDQRSRDTFHGYVLPSEALIVWLKDGIEAKLGTEAVPSTGQPENDAYIAVNRAYMSHLATSISGVVVLEVSDGINTEAIRGRVTRTNWWGADGEYSRLLNDALDDALLHVPAIRSRTDCAGSEAPSS